MARYEKWLTEVGPDAPVARAALAALATRLAAVEHYHKQAGRASGDSATDAETVHQLRIWTRRATAAIQLFEEVLPGRTARWLARKLKKIRRTAGQVRDYDVLASRLEGGDLPGLAPTAVHLRARRKRAEKKLARLYEKLVHKRKLRRKADKLLDKLKESGSKPGSTGKSRASAGGAPFGPWCRQALVPLADDFLAAAGGPLSRYEKLHALRIAGKRLRYALELAPAALAAAACRRLYDELSDLQDRLGQVCDQIVAMGQLKEWQEEAHSSAVRGELQKARARQRKQLADGRQAFLRWWSAGRRAAVASRLRRALKG